MAVRAFKVDAFAEKPFVGNPAGVCLLAEPREAGWMQAVAREMNLAETAFLRRSGPGFEIRWFTPAVEVELCGHATLASAHVLWETGTLRPDEQARFQSMSGPLAASRRGDLVELDFPATPPVAAAPPPGLLDALGVASVNVEKSPFDYLVEAASEEIVRSCAPDFARLEKVTTRGAIVTSRAAGGGFDFVSRFFAPAVGIPEDPVTGSAHCALGPYWSARLGKNELVAYQASSRGGVVRVRLDGDRVRLGGRAVTVLRGELAV